MVLYEVWVGSVVRGVKIVKFSLPANGLEDVSSSRISFVVCLKSMVMMHE